MNLKNLYSSSCAMLRRIVVINFELKYKRKNLLHRVYGYVMFYKFLHTHSNIKMRCEMQNFKDNCKASHKTHHPNDVLTSSKQRASENEFFTQTQTHTHIFTVVHRRRAHPFG